VKNGKIKFIDSISQLDINEREIFIKNIFQSGSSSTKFYLVTNIGILISHYLNTNNYQLTDLFLETTPGRLIFSNNFKNSIKK
jgi:hypothetical protein